MIQLLRDKKVIFFDVGYTLDRPASGDWMLTNRFLKEAGDRLKASSEADIRKAMEAGLRYLMENHLVTTVEAEISQFYQFYSILSDALEKSGVAASEAVFIDDSPRNLEGAAALDITPILIAANPASDVETPYLKIRDLRELIQESI